MVLHCPPRELVVLGVAFVVFGAIDQLDEVVDFFVRLCREDTRRGVCNSSAGILARSLAVARRSSCFYLNWSVAIRVRLEQVTLQ